MTDSETHKLCVNKFIELANELKKQGNDMNLVSDAMMVASGIYTTYVAAGNAGGLEPSGVDKLVMMYRRNLEHIQERKREESEKAAH